MKKQADRSRKEAEEYRVGDKVLISTKDFFGRVDEKSDEETDGKVYWTICGQKDHVGECGRIRITSVIKSTP